MGLQPFTVPHPDGRNVQLTPTLVSGTRRVPEWLFLAPSRRKDALVKTQVVHSLHSYGEAVFVLFRYAANNAAYEYDLAGHDEPLSSELPGIEHVGAPAVINALRSDGWPIRPVFWSCYHTEWCAFGLYGFAMSGGTPGGVLAAAAHQHIARLRVPDGHRRPPPDAALWPEEAWRRGPGVGEPVELTH
jgi:hypothetical protein